ncbi:MAG TPA: FecR family protein [Puia sp.]|jgi:ferric-dicitrate binding protein FerR (iron transport regulator)|nr:FecR family protein [Puia sp.]
MADEFNSMEDLAFSRSFRNWVLNKDAAERGFWENWIARNPDKADLVKYAKAMIYALHTDTTVLSADEIDEEVRKALVRLKEAPRYIPLDGPRGRTGWWAGLARGRRFWFAAAATAALGFGGFFIYQAHSHRDVFRAFLSNYKKEAVRQEVTDAIDDHAFNLPDGSLVRLGKSGKLYFPAEWARSPARREVFLRGEAYFDIRKNLSAPFYVYTDQVIIKALGTSFIIRSIPSDSWTTITMVTGKVSVYRQEDFYAHSPVGHAPEGMILTPNQEGVYDQGEDRLHRTLVGTPEQLGVQQDTSLCFEARPVREVFGRLQEMYGIPIQYDEEAAGCPVTVTLGDESFYDKLNIICKAIRGSYEVIDGNIVVTMPGCK